MPSTPCDSQFIQFLQDELAVSTAEISMALRHRERDNGPLAMILWQYGLISLDQLAQIFDWLDNQFNALSVFTDDSSTYSGQLQPVYVPHVIGI